MKRRAGALPGAAAPVLVAILLSIPGLTLGYFWDDYLFLTRIQSDPSALLRPDPGAMFYRPISQGLYFHLLAALGPAGAAAGHVANLVLLAAATWLLASLLSRSAGARAGVAGGFVFAASSCLPALVAYASGIQDLAAVFFLLLAFRLRDSGRPLAALAAASAAVLSKETALAVFPALVLWDRLLEKEPARVGRRAAAYGVVALAWAAIHPGIRALIGNGFRSGATGYVGLEHPERWIEYFARYALTAVNLPITGLATAWPARLTLACLAALAVIAAWAWTTRDAEPRVVEAGPWSVGRAARLGAWITIPPLALPALLVRPWGAYFVAVPSIGVAILGGVLLARLPVRRAALAAAAFLVLGVFSRGAIVPGAEVWTERTFVDAERAARRVEVAFRDLEPALAPGAHALVSVGRTGTLGLFQTLHRYDALRVWYRDPSIVTLAPETRPSSPAREYLFRVTPDLAVIEIDPRSGYFRASGGRARLDEVALPLRAYARGLAASGQPERGAAILGRLARLDPAPLRSYDLRVAASALRLAGRAAEAESLRATAPPLGPDQARDMVGQILAEPTVSGPLDALAWWAFEVSPSDPEALRYLIGQYRIGGYREPALAIARRLAAVAPGDSLAGATLRELEGGPPAR